MNNENNGCSEYSELSRRRFLIGSLGLAAAATASWVPKVALGQGSSTRDVLIHVYLRGGVDGLSLIVPHGDPSYYRHRPTIAVPPPDTPYNDHAIELDGFFGLPPAMARLHNVYLANQLAVIHAVGAPNWSRSHFDAQRWMEMGLASSGTTGWLGRHLATTQPMKAAAQLRGISMTYGMRQTLVGGPRSLPIPDLDSFGYSGWWQYEAEMAAWLQNAYARTPEPLKSIASDTQLSINLLNQIDFANYRPSGGAVYPEEWFGRSLKATAALLRADIGVEAIHLDLDGFDTHSKQGTTDGYLNNLLGVLGDSLHAFWQDLSGARRRNWTCVVVSEFGRTVRENSSKGTDHGSANAMLVMGPNVNGGRVYGQWPGLRDDQLFQGVDLTPTTDFRDILGEIVQKRLTNPDLASVFPGYTPTFRNIVK